MAPCSNTIPAARGVDRSLILLLSDRVQTVHLLRHDVISSSVRILRVAVEYVSNLNYIK